MIMNDDTTKRVSMKPVNKINRNRRAIALGLACLPAISLALENKPVIEMWKSPTCGCCTDWANHLEQNGFIVKAYTVGHEAMRKKLRMPVSMTSCHTALIGGYAIEGHVPAKEIKRLLVEKPMAIGLAVPAMPVGSPGMNGPEYGGQKDPYDVLLISMNGKPSIYKAYR
jgi:hypothetical protein